MYYLFFFNDTATTEIYTLSLHDALPICASRDQARKPYRRPAYDKERRQRDDERRQPGLDHQVSVQETDDEGDGEGEKQGSPQRPAELGHRDSDEDARGADHRADREVELTGDHEQRNRDGDDAKLRGNLKVAC